MARGYSRWASLGVGLLLVIASCGGDEGVEAGSSTSSATASTTTSPTAAGVSTLVPTSIGNIPGLTKECEGLANLMLGVVQVFGGSIDGADQLFAAAEGSLPSELSDDISLLRGAVEEFAAALADLGVNPFLDPTAFAAMTPEELQKFEEITSLLDNDEVNAAFDRVDEFGKSECNDFKIGG